MYYLVGLTQPTHTNQSPGPTVIGRANHPPLRSCHSRDERFRNNNFHLASPPPPTPREPTTHHTHTIYTYNNIRTTVSCRSSALVDRFIALTRSQFYGATTSFCVFSRRYPSPVLLRTPSTVYRRNRFRYQKYNLRFFFHRIKSSFARIYCVRRHCVGQEQIRE